MKTILTLACAASLIACADSQTDLTTSSQAPPLSSAMSHGTIPEGVDAWEARLALIEASKAVSSIVYRDRADTWEDVHQRMETYIADLPEDQRAFMWRVAPGPILRTHLLEGPPSREKAEAAATYLDMMVEAKSTDAELALATVERFASEWSPTYVSRVASALSGDALAYVENQEGCVDCAVPADAVPGAVSTDPRVSQKRSAALRLQEIAAR